MAALAFLHEHNLVNSLDSKANAQKWLNTAAMAGHVASALKLAKTEKNEHQVVLFLQIAASRGNIEARYKLGKIHQNGTHGLPKDETRAQGWFEMCGSFAKALRRRGFYQWNVKKDLKAAHNLFKEAAEQNDLKACMLIYHLFKDNDTFGTLMERSFAFPHLHRAANAGNDDAISYLAVGYLRGDSMRGFNFGQNFDLAAYWYERRTKPSTRILYRIGSMHENGWHYPKSMSKAIEYYLQAAEKDELAQVRLGKMYLTGMEDLKKDEAKAVAMFQKAADPPKNEPEALFELAECYMNGKGTPKNLYEAITCYQSAAAKGFDAAKKALKAYHDEQAKKYA
jgi:TPR repeat protein